MSNKNILISLTLILLVGFSFYAGAKTAEERQGFEEIQQGKQQKVKAQEAESMDNQKEKVWAVGNTCKVQVLINEYAARSDYRLYLSLYDFAAGETIEYNAAESFYPASMSKVIYLLSFLAAVETGQIDINDTYQLKERDKYVEELKVTGTGYLQYQQPGSKYTYDQLLNLMISQSDNIAANIILDIVGKDKINTLCKKHGLTATRISRKFYEVESLLPCNETNTRDLNNLLVKLENRSILNDYMSTKAIEMMKKSFNKNRIPRNLEHEIKIANKTGTVSNLVGDMGIIYFPYREPLAITIVLKSKDNNPINVDNAENLIGEISRDIVNLYEQRHYPALYYHDKLIKNKVNLRFIEGKPYIAGCDFITTRDSVIINRMRYSSLAEYCAYHDYSYEILPGGEGIKLSCIE